MTPKDFIDATDLVRVQMAKAILEDCSCRYNPNKTRLASVLANIALMIADLDDNIVLRGK